MPELEKRLGCTFSSLIDATLRALQAKQVGAVGLLASPTTIKTRLYQEKLEKLGMRVLLPTSQELEVVEHCIRSVIANRSLAGLSMLLESIIERLQSDGADTVILGCTELSVLFTGSKTDNITDPMTIITKELLV